jgi:hypothetical protein
MKDDRVYLLDIRDATPTNTGLRNSAPQTLAYARGSASISESTGSLPNDDRAGAIGAVSQQLIDPLTRGNKFTWPALTTKPS